MWQQEKGDDDRLTNEDGVREGDGRKKKGRAGGE